MRILLYGNGGSGNHGCEAIVRGTHELLQLPLRIHSASPDEDAFYGLNALGEIHDALSADRDPLSFLKAYLKLKLLKDYAAMDSLAYVERIHEARGKADIALSVGGDNYCYNGTEIYAYLNRMYRKAGFKTVLWGCSVEPDVVQKKNVAGDLCAYDLIVARESITYEAIKSIGANVMLAPDPAFCMKPTQCPVDCPMENTVGINVSPMIIMNEKESGIVYRNYVELVRYILEHTDMHIALIPHVIWPQSDDRTVLRRIYEEFEENDRITLVEDHCAKELKHIISICRAFVGARTHATIAAYSSCVPTLTVGYSVKARGIAKDLFGTDEKYVQPVQNLKGEQDLTDGFEWLMTHENEIRMYLSNMMPEYIARSERAKRALEELM